MALCVNQMSVPADQHPRVVDLDEGTMLPRIVSITGLVLIIAGIVFLVATMQHGTESDTGSSVNTVMPERVTVPAMRAMVQQMPTFEGSVPADDIGPTTYRIGVEGLAMRTVMSELPSR